MPSPAAARLRADAREYGVSFPTEEFSSDEAARGVRLSSLHARTAAAGAVFGAVGPSGFERPLHYDTGSGSSSGSASGSSQFSNAAVEGGYFVEEKLSFDAREAGWWSAVEAEHNAAREGVALFDLSSFGKLRVSGRGAEAAMEHCASSIVGGETTRRVLYTQLLNERGGVESDLTIVPQPAADGAASGREFYVVSSAELHPWAIESINRSIAHGVQLPALAKGP